MFGVTLDAMTAQEAFSMAVWVVALLFLFLLIWKVRRRKTSGERRVRSGPGPGASGAVYDMLNEDKRRAIEIIVEGRAEATDPEHADGTPESGR
jgi:hypothetical protein